MARALPPPWAFRQRQLSGYGTDGTDVEETKDVEVPSMCQVMRPGDEAGMRPKNLGCFFCLVVAFHLLIKMISGQFITTSAEVTPNGGLVRDSPPKMALNQVKDL